MGHSWTAGKKWRIKVVLAVFLTTDARFSLETYDIIHFRFECKNKLARQYQITARSIAYLMTLKGPQLTSLYPSVLLAFIYALTLLVDHYCRWSQLSIYQVHDKRNTAFGILKHVNTCSNPWVQVSFALSSDVRAIWAILCVQNIYELLVSFVNLILSPYKDLIIPLSSYTWCSWCSISKCAIWSHLYHVTLYYLLFVSSNFCTSVHS